MHGSSSVPQEWLAIIRENGGEHQGDLRRAGRGDPGRHPPRRAQDQHRHRHPPGDDRCDAPRDEQATAASSTRASSSRTPPRRRATCASRASRPSAARAWPRASSRCRWRLRRSATADSLLSVCFVPRSARGQAARAHVLRPWLAGGRRGPQPVPRQRRVGVPSPGRPRMGPAPACPNRLPRHDVGMRVGCRRRPGAATRQHATGFQSSLAARCGSGARQLLFGGAQRHHTRRELHRRVRVLDLRLLGRQQRGQRGRVQAGPSAPRRAGARTSSPPASSRRRSAWAGRRRRPSRASARSSVPARAGRRRQPGRKRRWRCGSS